MYTNASIIICWHGMDYGGD